MGFTDAEDVEPTEEFMIEEGEISNPKGKGGGRSEL